MSPAAKDNLSPLEHAAKLRTRDRVVALGEALRTAGADSRDAMACMLIELASRDASAGGGGADAGGHAAGQAAGHAAGPVELLTRLPVRWRCRHADEAMFLLAWAWPNLSADIRPLAVSLGRDRWIGAVRALSKRPEVDARLAALAIAHDTADPGLGRVVSSLLGDEAQRVRLEADRALLRMSLKLLDHLPPALLGEHFARIACSASVSLPADPAVLGLERCTLYGAVCDAAWSFASHRCRSALIASLLLMDRAVSTALEREIGDRMRRLLAQRNHPSHAPLRSVLKRTDCPLLRERALRWLTIPAISTAALDRLCIAETDLEHEIVLRVSHLALRPARASRLCTLGRVRSGSGTGVLPGRARWGVLSEPARCGLIAMSVLVGERDEDRRARTEPALADGSAMVRLTGAAFSTGADLADYLFDPDGRVARHAALRWSTLGIEPPRVASASGSVRVRLAEHSGRSMHAFVRRVAGEERARLTMDDPHDPSSRSQARRLLRADPAGFARLVRERLSSPDLRNEAITLVRLLGVERRFELDLIGIVQDGDGCPRARASAVMALGRIDSNAARYTLSESLGAADPRTRANAVETAPLESDRLLEFKDDPHHRVRANAVRRVLTGAVAGNAASGAASGAAKGAVIGVSTGAAARAASDALVDLLGDPRPEHRLAGAWAAQRTLRAGRRSTLGVAWNPVVSRLEALAGDDEDPYLRTRARACIERLARELRLGSGAGASRGDADSWGA